MSWSLLQNSLAFAGLVTALAAGFGVVVALSLAGLDPKWRVVGLALAGLTLALPPFLVTNCWLDLFGETGPWRSWLPVKLYSLPSAAIILALILWPIPAFASVAAWQRLEAAHFEADPLLRGFALLRHLLLPVAWPALSTSAVLVFVLALANFGLPSLLQVKVFTAEIWLRFSTNYDFAGALSASLPVVIAPVLLWLWLRRGEVAWPRWQGAVPPRLVRQQLGAAIHLPACGLAALIVAFAVGLPLTRLATAPHTWTEVQPALAAGGAALWSSFWLAAVTATLTMALGLASWRWRFGPAFWLSFLLPGVFLGIVLIWTLNRPPWVALYQSVVVVVLALGIRYLGPAWQAASLARRSADAELIEAARLEGASHWQVFRLALWPQIGPALAAGWYVVYLLALWDVETLVVIVPPGMETLSLRIFNLLHYGHNPQVNALCLALLGLALLPLLAWGLWRAANVFRLGNARRIAAVASVLAALLLPGCSPAANQGTALRSRFFSRIEIIGTRGRGPGQFNKPRGVVVDRNDNLYVEDMTGRIQKFAPDGTFLLEWQMPETARGEPKGLGLDRDGNVIVIEPHYSRVNQFTPEGKLVRQWGVHGTNVGQFTLPRGVALNAQGELWICEYTAVHRIQRFTPDGSKILACFGHFGEGDGELNRPEALCVDARQQLHVADSCNHRIQVFDPTGKWLRSFGHAGSGPGEFSYPYDIKLDPAGNQFVCEFGNSRLQIFDAKDQPLETIGGPGAAPGQFSNPWSIALDSHGNLYVADGGNHRVQKLIRREPLVTAGAAQTAVVARAPGRAPR